MVLLPPGWSLLLPTGALAGLVALGAPLLWAGWIQRSWARTRTELVALAAPWSRPIPDPRWASLVPRLLALRGPDPLSERAEGGYRLGSAVAEAFRRKRDIDAELAELQQAGERADGADPAVRALRDRLDRGNSGAAAL